MLWFLLLFPYYEWTVDEGKNREERWSYERENKEKMAEQNGAQQINVTAHKRGGIVIEFQ